jgi:hypothetical protein
MAKIKKISCRPTIWLVRVSVKDPSCTFSINPEISYMRLVKAFNANAALKAAATYCNNKMKPNVVINTLNLTQQSLTH